MAGIGGAPSASDDVTTACRPVPNHQHEKQEERLARMKSQKHDKDINVKKNAAAQANQKWRSNLGHDQEVSSKGVTAILTEIKDLGDSMQQECLAEMRLIGGACRRT